MSSLAIMLTRRCNMACSHCSVESGPKAGSKGPPLSALLDTVREAATAGVRYVNVTGGEPMLRERVALEILRECRRLGIVTRLTTNGFWGRTPERAERTLRDLIGAGLGALTVSYDRFHAAFQGPDPVVHIAHAAKELGSSFEVNVTRLADDREIGDLIAPFAHLPSIRLRFYDVQPVGAARHLPGAELRSEVEGFCNACEVAALTDDGRVTACNGPSYFLPAGHPLVIGSVAEESLGTLLRRHEEDPILGTIRTQGPAGLRDALREIPAFASFPFRERYSGMCDLCHHMTSSPDAVIALREVLSTPDRVAARFARQQLIEVERHGRSLSREYVNTIGAARAFLALAAGDPAVSDEADRVLGRADLDWHAQVERLTGAGLARALAARLGERDLARWAPALFGARVREAAAADDAREADQRAALARLAAEVRARGATGIVLGAPALWEGDPGNTPRRAVARVVVVVPDPAVARSLRQANGSRDGLPPVVVRSRLLPSTWGMPTREMIETATPIPEPALEGLRMLAPAESLVYALVSASAGGLREGVAAAWDARMAIARGVDVQRLQAIVSRLPAPRAFWVPARVLSDRLGTPVPFDALRGVPDDVRTRRLERIAARRLFGGPGRNPAAEWSFRWAWPVLAGGTHTAVGRRLPGVAARVAGDLPSAWSDIAGGGIRATVREARRLATAWVSAADPG